MKVRYVAEADPTRQALLEIYVAVASSAKHMTSTLIRHASFIWHV